MGIGEDKMIKFSGVALGEACTVVLRGGCSEMLMANAVQNLALKTPGKESVAMEAFARALRQLPTVIADNAGYDSSQLVSELRAVHNEGKSDMGLDMQKARWPTCGSSASQSPSRS